MFDLWGAKGIVYALILMHRHILQRTRLVKQDYISFIIHVPYMHQIPPDGVDHSPKNQIMGR